MNGRELAISFGGIEENGMERVLNAPAVILRGVEKPDASYVLPVQGEVENWFGDLLETKEGYESQKEMASMLLVGMKNE